MTNLTGSSCYFCGNIPDGSDDHVPPEVLFKGTNGRSYKSPKIITVASCRKHNDSASQDDEILAWIMSDAGALRSHVAFDVHQALLAPVSERIHKDREFADERLAHGGIRVFRDPKDYDEHGNPKAQTYDAEYFKRAERSLREKWMVLERSLQKIAAGLFYASQGQSLGVIVAGRLTVVVPDFKQVGTAITLTGLNLDETTYFAKGLPWQPIVSGSPKVFQCDIARHSNSRRFAMRMLFYESIRVWVKLDDSGHSVGS